ncbi:MAG: hypothetical protein KKH37_09585, partial [Alphaproteobacteria bacterium]|nr:hypothetical protein [Alphaproteobacteria bacterium]
MAEEIDTGIDETANGDSEGLVPEQAHEQEQAYEPAPERRHHRGRTVLKWVGIALAAVIALVVAAVLLLDTGPGRRFVVNQIEALEFENGMEVGIGRIEGSLYGEMILYDFSLADPRGAFLTSPEMRVDWRPFAFAS